jgi:hypothetical protein
MWYLWNFRSETFGLEIHGVIFYFSFTNLCQTKERISNWRRTLGLEKSTLEDLSVLNMAKPL